MTTKGFTLIELLVVLALMGALTVMGTNAYVAIQKRQQLNRSAEALAADFQQVLRASKSYVDANQATWAAGSTTVVTIPTLIAGGFLPTAFGTRPTGAAQTPVGQAWRIVSIRNTGSTPGARTVVTETAAANGAILESLGLLADGSDLMTIKSLVAASLAIDKIPAGTLIAGNTTATGAGNNAWTKDLSAWFSGATPAYATVAAMIGFSDLDVIYNPTLPINSTCTAGEIVRGFCSGNPLCSNNGQGYIAPTCPSGKRKVGEYPHCKTTEVFQYNSGLGSSLILGRREIDTGQGRDAAACDTYADQFSSDPGSTTWANHHRECTSDRNSLSETTVYVDGPQDPNFCGIVTQGFAPNPFSPGQMQLANSTQTWGYPAARDFICAICP